MVLTMTRGKSAQLLVTVTRAGQLVELTGKTLRFAAKRPRDAAPAITKSSGVGITHDPDQTGEGKGLATVKLDPADTAGFPDYVDELEYGVQLEEGSDLWPIDAGVLMVRPNVVP